MSPFGIVTALPAEAQTLFGGASIRSLRLQSVTHCGSHLLVVSGMGAAAARTAAERLIASGVTCLISWGVAGALAPELRTGDIVIPHHVIAANSQRLSTSTDWRGRAIASLRSRATHGGVLLESTSIVQSPPEKQQLYAETSAVAVDMESYAIAHTAAKARVPFIAVRAIVDEAAQSIPSAALAATSADGSVRIGVLLRAILSPRREIPALILLGRSFSKARRSLRECAVDFLSAI